MSISKSNYLTEMNWEIKIQITKKQYKLLLEEVSIHNRKLFTPICTWYGDEYKYDDEQEYYLIIDDLKKFIYYINLEGYEAVEKMHGLPPMERNSYCLYKDILKQINKED